MSGMSLVRKFTEITSLYFLYLQYEAALAVDSVDLIYKVIQTMINPDSASFRRMLNNRKGVISTSAGTDCDAEPLQVQWPEQTSCIIIAD